MKKVLFFALVSGLFLSSDALAVKNPDGSQRSAEEIAKHIADLNTQQPVDGSQQSTDTSAGTQVDASSTQPVVGKLARFKALARKIGTVALISGGAIGKAARNNIGKVALISGGIVVAVCVAGRIVTGEVPFLEHFLGQCEDLIRVGAPAALQTIRDFVVANMPHHMV